jgi:parallel beta-helix repeat protein
MKYRVIAGTVLTLLLTSMLPLVHGIQSVRPSENIYIRADGSIEGTTDISTVDKVTYIFKHDIYQGIVVERDNILVDGASYALEGTYAVESGNGIEISDRNNVTIKNVEIKEFSRGIWLSGSTNSNISGNTLTANSFYGIYLRRSSNNTISTNTIKNNEFGIYAYNSWGNRISGNTIENNDYGIWLYPYSSNNMICRNTITANSEVGVGLYWYSSNNMICRNTITANSQTGIEFSRSSNNTVYENAIRNNINCGVTFYYSSNNNSITGNIISKSEVGVGLYYYSSNNIFYHNTFSNHKNQVYLETTGENIWDDNYPSGGNYWSDYIDVDKHSGPYQNETGVDGIWDNQYVIDQNNQDNYPLIPESPSFPAIPILIVASLLAVIVFNLLKPTCSKRNTEDSVFVRTR